jgi:transposase
MEQFTRFVGLDDSKNAIDVAIAEGGPDGEVRYYGTIPNTPEAVLKLVRRLGPREQLLFAYEAGPCGYETYRLLRGWGVACQVVAPSKTPRRTGDRIKTDHRDAVALVRLLRAGELVPVWVPDEETEAMRDLTRGREDAKFVETRARQRLSAFLLRHGRRYPGATTWGGAHAEWVSKQTFPRPSQLVVLGEYSGAVEEATRRVRRLDEQIRELVPLWSMAPVVKAYQAFRGVSMVVGSTVASELGDIRRFDSPKELMGFVGLVPWLRATGLSSYSGGITRTGNSHVRRCLVEAALAYRHPAKMSNLIRLRQRGQLPEVEALAWKAQVRLCGRFRKLRARGKDYNKVVTAIARELVGFLWAAAQIAAPGEARTAH